MNYFLSSLLLFTLLFGASCSQKKPAKIVNHASSFYGKKGYASKNKNSAAKIPARENQLEIKSGDTLYLVARKANVSIRDLIKENNLTAPYNLKQGDVLSLPRAQYHEVKAGDSLYSISRNYNMNLDQLVSLNDLKQPYSVKVGQRLRVSENKSAANLVKIDIKEEPQVISAKEEQGFFTKNSNKSGKFSWPIKGKIISKFGPKSGGLYNDGINILAKEGADVKAAQDGIVAYVGNELKGYGNLVIVKHPGGFVTAYAHLKDAGVKRGQKINKGDKIARVGMSGNVDAPQLYFGLRKGRDAVDPLNYL
jgi:murein DD-endopeptidase MepM/ murein hydrolase activator NlpD